MVMKRMTQETNKTKNNGFKSLLKSLCLGVNILMIPSLKLCVEKDQKRSNSNNKKRQRHNKKTLICAVNMILGFKNLSIAIPRKLKNGWVKRLPN